MKAIALALLISCAALTACGKKEPAPAPVPEPTAAPAAPASAQSTLASASGSSVKGTLQLAATDGGVQLTGEITGLAPSTIHGFHAHEKGDCSAPDASSAGEHFNPTMAPHGGPSSVERHIGDFPNVESSAQGVATVNATVAGASLRDGGPHDLVGKALVVHARRDDYVTQPSGDSGDRVACGVIQ